jgi:hypothetical protein
MSVSVSVPEELYAKAEALAASRKVSVDEVFAAAFVEQLAAWERLQRRAERAGKEKFLAVLNKVPDVEPEEFDRF